MSENIRNVQKPVFIVYEESPIRRCNCLGIIELYAKDHYHDFTANIIRIRQILFNFEQIEQFRLNGPKNENDPRA